MITTEKFLEAWEKYPPTNVERFYFKHFSASAVNKKISWFIFLVLLVPFLLGYGGTIIKANYDFVKVATLTFALMLVMFAIPWIYTWYVHNRRIKKIAKYLNCSLEEYEIVADKCRHLVK